MKATIGEVKKIIKSALQLEKAVTPKQAESSGLALVVTRQGSGHSYVLYDAKQAIKLFASAAKSGGIDAIPDNVLSNIIVGILNVQEPDHPSNGASEVSSVAARSGYGPLLYDIAMAMEGGLISDRNAVSTFARKVWSKYQSRSDVKSKPLDDYSNPKTPDPSDDADVFPGEKNNPLNYSYTIDKTPRVSELMARHEDLLVELESSIGYSGDQVETSLIWIAMNYFSARYRSEVVATGKSGYNTGRTWKHAIARSRSGKGTSGFKK